MSVKVPPISAPIRPVISGQLHHLASASTDSRQGALASATQGRAQALGSWDVHAPTRFVDNDAIVVPRSLSADQPVAQVGQHGPGIPEQRIAPPATAGSLVAQD